MVFIKLEMLYPRHSNISISGDVWSNLNIYIEQESKSKLFAYRMFIWNNQTKDFISLVNDSLLENKNLKTFNNETISANAVKIHPYILFDNETNKITGLVGDIWQLCEEYLHFKTELYIADLEVASAMLTEGITKVMLAPGAATGAYPMLEFSQPFYYYNSYQLYTRLPDQVPNPMFFLHALETSLWYACLILIIILAICLFFTIKILNKFCQKNKKNIEPSLSPFTCFLLMIAGAFNQGVNLHLNTLTTRMQFFLALVFGYIVYSAFSAVLVAELAVANIPIPFDTFEGIVDKKLSICARPNSYVYDILEVRANRSEKWAHYINGPGCPDMQNPISIKDSICQKNVVIFESNVVMSKTLIDPNWNCGILILGGKDLFRKANSLIFHRGLKNKKTIFWFLEKIRGNGILQKIQSDWVVQIKDNLNQPIFNEVSLVHIKGILQIYVYTIIISFIVLIIECIVKKINTCVLKKYGRS